MRIIMRCLTGSKLYGLKTPQSDTDYKSIYLPTVRELLLNDYKPIISISKHGKNGPDDVDQEIIALPRFIDLACRQKPVAYEMLHAKDANLLECDPIWNMILSHRQRFYTRNATNFIGFAKDQSLKYEVKGMQVNTLEHIISVCEAQEPGTRLKDILDKLPINEYAYFEDAENRGKQTTFYVVNGAHFETTAKLNHIIKSVGKRVRYYGHRVRQAQGAHGKSIDWSSIAHALRSCYMMRSILKNGDFEFPLEESPYLLRVKLGQLSFDETKVEMENIMAELESLQVSSELPDVIDTKFWDDKLMEIYELALL